MRPENKLPPKEIAEQFNAYCFFTIDDEAEATLARIIRHTKQSYDFVDWAQALKGDEYLSQDKTILFVVDEFGAYIRANSRTGLRDTKTLEVVQLVADYINIEIFVREEGASFVGPLPLHVFEKILKQKEFFGFVVGYEGDELVVEYVKYG